jgi:hypothetical protein
MAAIYQIQLPMKVISDIMIVTEMRMTFEWEIWCLTRKVNQKIEPYLLENEDL